MKPYIGRLTEPLSGKMATATRKIFEDLEEPDDTYKLYCEDERGRRTVSIIERETESPIFRVKVFTPQPPGRINTRIDVYSLDSEGDLQRVALLRNNEEETINITYQDPKRGEKMQNSRRGTKAGHKTGKFVLDILPKL